MPRSRVRASITRAPSRQGSGTHSVQPVATSVSTSVHANAPARLGPECATRSISMNPGGGSSQSLNVRIRTLRRTAFTAPARRRPAPPRSRTSRKSRSIVAALIISKRLRTSGSSCRWPCRSIAGTSTGSEAFSRLPQIRSELSHRTISAARAASSYTHQLSTGLDHSSFWGW